MMIVSINAKALTKADMSPSNALDPAWVRSGEIQEFHKVLFASPDNKFIVQVWENRTALELSLESYPVDEFITLIEGEVEVVDHAGNVSRFKAGDSFLLVKGFKGIWRQPGYLRKYAIWNIR